MTRILIILAFCGLILGLGFAMTGGEETPWSTENADALIAFEEGLAAQNRLYQDEAREHFQQAVHLDPDFAVAKAKLLRVTRDKDTRDQYAIELANAPLDVLSEREQFLVRYTLFNYEGNTEAALAELDAFTTRESDDPFGLTAKADIAFARGRWQEASDLYEKILATSPNWVDAQNRLGYIAMAQGRFEESEGLFHTYEFIAPDQANPHDSLGELYTLTGRYREARKHLEKALEIKPDFCASYDHLISLFLLEEDFEQAPEVLIGAAEHCDEHFSAYLDCRVRLWELYLDMRFEDAWNEENAACMEKSGDITVLSHRIAVSAGRFDEAIEREEQQLSGWRKLDPEDLTVEAMFLRSIVKHLAAVRHAAQGEWDQANELFEKADEHFLYQGNSGVLKLYNRLNWAHSLEASGDVELAEKVLDEVAAVNPEVAADFDEIHFPGSPR